MLCVAASRLLATSAVITSLCRQVEWRVVFSGLLLQVVLAFLVLRWSAGSSAVRYAGDAVVHFLGYSDEGAAFVYGDFRAHEFAFQV